jgi:phenylalanyl-tRNA synthetase alpha chain
LIERLESLVHEAQDAIGVCKEPRGLEDLRVKYLGKSGSITDLLKNLGQVPADQRPLMGKTLNEAKSRIQSLLESRLEALEGQGGPAAPQGWDPTLPGRTLPAGSRHPLKAVQAEICGIFREGPDVETDHYNFLALNFPPDHPARDAQDTFYLGPDLLMRTHTSPIQVRVMEKWAPPHKFVAPGRVYRNEAVDATHHHIFHQVEGFLVDEGIHFGHLKGVLDVFIKRFFGSKVRTRFRPSFFPFTEPSAEMDISCVFCDGKGCRICKRSGWVEMMGCGMIDPAVLSNCKVDPEKWTGFAFGMGVERIALFKYDIDDIRLFYQNDLRFLRQF